MEEEVFTARCPDCSRPVNLGFTVDGEAYATCMKCKTGVPIDVARIEFAVQLLQAQMKQRRGNQN